MFVRPEQADIRVKMRFRARCPRDERRDERHLILSGEPGNVTDASRDHDFRSSSRYILRTSGSRAAAPMGRAAQECDPLDSVKERYFLNMMITVGRPPLDSRGEWAILKYKCADYQAPMPLSCHKVTAMLLGQAKTRAYKLQIPCALATSWQEFRLAMVNVYSLAHCL